MATMKNTYKINEEAVKKIAERVYDNGSTVINRNDLEEMFPELKKESEDERIRKAIKLMYSFLPNKPKYIGDVSVEDMFAWLEKQGEHANFRNKIQIGDKVTRNEDGVLVNLSQLNRVAKKDEKQGKKNPVEMKSPEESLGISSDEYNKIVDECIFGEQKPIEVRTTGYWHVEDVEQKPWSEEDEMHLHSIESTIEFCKRGNANVSLIVQNYNADLDWLKSLKDRVLPQPKQEWSEEEIENCAREAEDNNCIILAKHIRQLKSLRPQSTWKPSEEQLGLLERVFNGETNPKDVPSSLKIILEQLKKLRGE